MIIGAIIVILLACLGVLITGLRIIDAIQNRKRFDIIAYSIMAGFWAAVLVLRVISLIMSCVGG